MKKSHEGGQRKTPGRAPEPHVGIFWVVSGKLVIDITPLGEAEPYGDFKTYPRGHAEVWEQWRMGKILERKAAKSISTTITRRAR